jgi:hypothetical protein
VSIPHLSELANGSPANPVVSSDATLPGQTDTLAAPTSALPESLSSVSTEAIAAPETTPTTGFSAPSAPTVAETTPDEVVAPDANVAPPNVGATAQDGPLDVVMPEELTASVPSVGGDTPAPIETVIPPVGWTPDTTVDATQTGTGTDCTRIVDQNQYLACTNADDLDEESRQKLEELKATLGDNADDLIEELEKDLLNGFGNNARNSTYIKNWLAGQLGVDPDQLGLNDGDLAFTAATLMVGNFILMTADSGPAVQIELLKSYKAQIADGAMDAFGFKDLLTDMVTKPFYNQEYSPTSIAMSGLGGMYQSPELMAACSGSTLSTNGGPGYDRSVCSGDAYGNLIPSEYQGEVAAMMGMSLLGTAAIVAAGVEIGAAVVGYASLYSPYVAARMNQMAPNLMARFNAMRALGAVAKPTGIPVVPSGTQFVTTPKGYTVSVPAGWTSRIADNNKGIVFQRPGATGNSDMIRIMEPTGVYPNGFVRYYNSGGQPLNLLGKPGDQASTHIPLDFIGLIPGWPVK